MGGDDREVSTSTPQEGKESVRMVVRSVPCICMLSGSAAPRALS